MHECPADDSALPSLFDPAGPDSPALWAVLEGRHTGRALVNDLQNPSQCLLRTDAVLAFANRGISRGFLHDAVACFRPAGPLWLVWPGDAPAGPLPPQSDHVTPRLEFDRCDPHSALLADWRRRLPDGCGIRPIDGELLQHCEWQSDMAFWCGSEARFLAHGLGLCLMQGDEILVEAYVSSFGAGRAEIGAITRERYRGREYAAIACACLIQEVEGRGYAPVWSCDSDHLASVRVAQKLGFQNRRAYQVLEYEPPDRRIP